ncbi:hypothetical protein H0W80_00230 [Candidatus Saccharibacteria bacterium]|nr:hypothetical protein [Candidatus Saccharibacteria bacterium]
MGDTLAVVLPSRGLLFSETLEELLNELEGFKYKIFWSHARSLPDCFNIPTEEALKDPSIFAVLFAEDDMILPKGVLKKMFGMNYPVVALDYPFRNNGDSTMWHDPEGFVLWSGTGFLLVAKQVLENMQKPIWITNTTWDTMVKQDRVYIWPRKLTKVAYGLHDVNFGMTLYSQGLRIKDVEMEGGQRKLRKLGRAKVNNGAHDIKELNKIGRDLVIKTTDPRKIAIFKQALSRIRSIELCAEAPDFIEYVDGQATVRGEEHETV